MDDTWLRKTMENASSMESSERAWVTKSTQTFLRSALKQWTANWWTNAQTSMAPRSTLLAPSRMCFDQRASRGRPVSALSVRAYEEQLVYVVVTYDRSKPQNLTYGPLLAAHQHDTPHLEVEGAEGARSPIVHVHNFSECCPDYLAPEANCSRLSGIPFVHPNAVIKNLLPYGTARSWLLSTSAATFGPGV